MSESSLSVGQAFQPDSQAEMPGLRRPLPPPIVPERGLTPAQWGMIAFLVSEVAFFSTLIVVYLAFLGADQSGPTPAVLSLRLVIFTTICLLSSSVTVHQADKALRSGSRADFRRWRSAALLLGILFRCRTPCACGLF